MRSRAEHGRGGPAVEKFLMEGKWSEGERTSWPVTRAWVGYAVAVGGTVVAALARWWLGMWVGGVSPFTTFYPAVIAAAVVGGAGPGIVAAVLGGLTADWFFLPPVGRLWPMDEAQVTELTLFIGVNVAISLVGGRLRREHQATLASESRYRSLFQSMDEGFCVIEVLFDEEGRPNDWRFLESNPACSRHNGLEKAPGKTMRQLVPNLETRWFEAFGRVAVTGEPNRFSDFSAALHRWLDLYAFRVGEPGECKVAVLFTDITERKRTEVELARLREQLAADLAAMSRLHDLSTRFLRQEEPRSLLESILEAAIAITAASKGNVQLVDRTTGELGIEVQRGFDTEFIRFFSHISAGTVACGAAMQTRRCVVVEDITTSPLFQTQPRALKLELAAGMRAVTCIPLLTRAGEPAGVLSVHFLEPHRPSERDLRLLDLLARQAADFVERSGSEEALREARDQLAKATAQLEEQVRQRTVKLEETVAELEHMSHSMVHDMRAPLRAMQGFTSILEEECAGCIQTQCLEYFRRIREASNRLDQLITDALNYNQVVREEIPLTPVELGGLLRGLTETYPNLQAQAADIRIEFNGLTVLGNESLLTQCFGNLLDNAVKFVARGVKPQVRVWAEEAKEEAQSLPREGASGRSEEGQAKGGAEKMGPETGPARPKAPPASGRRLVRIWVEDNGIGIPKEGREKLFGMFQRMHPLEEYPGTGIGLAIVRKAIERIGGQVGVESEPGKGSRFWVELTRPGEGVGERHGQEMHFAG